MLYTVFLPETPRERFWYILVKLGDPEGARRTRESSGQVVLVRIQSEMFLTIRKGLIGPRPMQILPDVHARQKWYEARVERTFLSRLFASRSTTDPPASAKPRLPAPTGSAIRNSTRFANDTWV